MPKAQAIRAVASIAMPKMTVGEGLSLYASIFRIRVQPERHHAAEIREYSIAITVMTPEKSSVLDEAVFERLLRKSQIVVKNRFA